MFRLKLLFFTFFLSINSGRTEQKTTLTLPVEEKNISFFQKMTLGILGTGASMLGSKYLYDYFSGKPKNIEKIPSIPTNTENEIPPLKTLEVLQKSEKTKQKKETKSTFESLNEIQKVPSKGNESNIDKESGFFKIVANGIEVEVKTPPEKEDQVEEVLPTQVKENPNGQVFKNNPPVEELQKKIKEVTPIQNPEVLPTFELIKNEETTEKIGNQVEEVLPKVLTNEEINLNIFGTQKIKEKREKRQLKNIPEMTIKNSSIQKYKELKEAKIQELIKNESFIEILKVWCTQLKNKLKNEINIQIGVNFEDEHKKSFYEDIIHEKITLLEYFFGDIQGEKKEIWKYFFNENGLEYCDIIVCLIKMGLFEAIENDNYNEVVRLLVDTSLFLKSAHKFAYYDLSKNKKKNELEFSVTIPTSKIDFFREYESDEVFIEEIDKYVQEELKEKSEKEAYSGHGPTNEQIKLENLKMLQNPIEEKYQVFDFIRRAQYQSNNKLNFSQVFKSSLEIKENKGKIQYIGFNKKEIKIENSNFVENHYKYFVCPNQFETFALETIKTKSLNLKMNFLNYKSKNIDSINEDIKQLFEIIHIGLIDIIEKEIK